VAYPNPPSGWLRSGWISSQLIPDMNYHAQALQYLGGIGTPLAQPSVSGTPNPSGISLSQPPNSLYSPPANSAQAYQTPDWLNQLLFGMNTPQQTAAPKAPQGPALVQQTSPVPLSSQFSTPQFGSTRPKKKGGGLFGFILDTAPGSPTLFM
jgi:hypothetical protein